MKVIVNNAEEKKICCNCGKLVSEAESTYFGKKYAFCTECQEKYPARWTQARLKDLTNRGINRDASGYTQVYIQRLPEVLKQEAKERRKKYLERNKIMMEV